MSFSLGIPHLLLGVSGFVLLCHQAEKLDHARRRDLSDMTVFAITAIGGAFLAIDWSAPIWTDVHILQYLQQPWRSLFLPALFIPLFALYAFERIGARMASVALVVLVLFNIAHTAPKGVQSYDEAYFGADLIAQKEISATTREEYEPRTVHQRPDFDSILLRGVRSAPVVSQLAVRSNSQSFKVDAGEPALMQDSLFDYPGWTVLVDDREVATSPASVSGEITFNVPAGTHNVLVELRPTPIRRWSFYVSLATGALMTLIVIFALVSAWNRAEPDDKTKPGRASKARSRKRSRRAPTSKV